MPNMLRADACVPWMGVSRDDSISSDVRLCGTSNSSAPPLHIQGSSAAHNSPKPNHIFFTRPTSTSRNTAIMMNFVLSLLLQLSMFMLAEAAPMTVQSAKPWQAGTGGGIIGFIVLVLDIIAWSKQQPRPPRRACRASFKANTCCSRDLQVQPPRPQQGALGTRRLPLPRRRHDHLLPLLQPSSPQHLRAYSRISDMTDLHVSDTLRTQDTSMGPCKTKDMFS